MEMTRSVKSKAKEMIRTRSVRVKVTLPESGEEFILRFFQRMGGVGLADWEPKDEVPSEEVKMFGKEMAFAALKSTLERAAKLQFQGVLPLPEPELSEEVSVTEDDGS